MAWNQPGGNGSKDPWGDRGSQRGPPDLDEVLKKLQAALARVFGGGPRIPSGAGGLGGKGVWLVLLVAALGYGAWGFYVVDPPEQGVVLRFGKFLESTGPGPHWVARPFYDVEKVNVEQIHQAEIGFRSADGTTGSVPDESLMLTEDENIIDIKFAVLYQIREPDKYLFNVLDPDNTLRQATETAVREVVGRSKMDHVLTEGRGEVAAEVQVLIQDILTSYGTGLQLTSVNMQEAQPPREVQDAFDDAVKAREDEVRSKNEARAYAADILPKARGDANTVRERARAYKAQVVAASQGETDRFLKVLREYEKAPEVTRERLYIESVESVIGNSSKVLLDVEGGNNLIYLPIDKLIDSGAGSTRSRATEQTFDQPDDIGSAYGDEISTQDGDSRGRARD